MGFAVRPLAAVVAVLLFVNPVPQRRDLVVHPAADCGPVDDQLRTPDSARVQPGAYRLTMVAAGGSRTGHQTSGVLQLWRTSAADRSPTRPTQRPPAGDTARAPLYGTAAIDWSAVAAPIDKPDTSGDPALSDSRDPLHPGVLVLIQNWDGPGLRQSALIIGTHRNRRVDDHTMNSDGPGIFLSVRRFTDTGFEGTWGNFGIVANGSGYFCAVRTLR
jgi:hypothetical protein